MRDHTADNVRTAYHHRTFLLGVGTCHRLSLPFDVRNLAIEVAFADVEQLWRYVSGRHIVGSVLQRYDRSPSFAEARATCSRSCRFPGHTCVWTIVSALDGQMVTFARSRPHSTIDMAFDKGGLDDNHVPLVTRCGVVGETRPAMQH